MESGPCLGAVFFCRVGSWDALRMVGLALSSAAAAMFGINGWDEDEGEEFSRRVTRPGGDTEQASRSNGLVMEVLQADGDVSGWWMRGLTRVGAYPAWRGKCCPALSRLTGLT